MTALLSVQNVFQAGVLTGGPGARSFVSDEFQDECDLRTQEGWSGWLSQLDEVDRSTLLLGGYEFEASTNSVLLTFPSEALHLLTEEFVTHVAAMMRMLDAEKVQNWSRLQTELGLDPREVPESLRRPVHLQIEFAPPFMTSH